MDAIQHENDYVNDHKNFISPYFSVENKEDTLIVTTLMNEHCVDETVGVIDVQYETIYLKNEVIMTGEPYCPLFYKYTFVIHNPGNNDYKIVSVM